MLRQLLLGVLASIRRAGALALDRSYHLETVGNVPLSDLGIDPRDRVHYAPSSWSSLSTVARIVPFTPTDTFVDFGSGKGRIVVMAARKYPMKRIVGVEISSELTEIARRNAVRNGTRLLCRSIDFVTADATVFTIPDDMTIAYFYSPFTGAVFRRVIDNIEVIVRGRSLNRLWVVLVRPTVGSSADLYRANDDYLNSRAWLSRVADIETRTWSGWTIVTSFYKLAIESPQLRLRRYTQELTPSFS
jgi:hypothetical protein